MLAKIERCRNKLNSSGEEKQYTEEVFKIMENWSGNENDAMRGYLIYAGEFLLVDKDSNFTESILKELLKKLYRATDDLTAEQARQYYLQSKYQ